MRIDTTNTPECLVGVKKNSLNVYLLLLVALACYLACGSSVSHSAEEAPHGVYLSAQDLGPDIPPVGSSYFDKLFYNPDLSRYEIPSPIEALAKTIEKKEPESFSVAPFFFSRSLQRPVDLSFNPLKHPRMVFSVSRGPGKGQIFIGSLSPKDQLEVISYNEEMGRYEFQIVSNYKTKPQVTYAVRAKCMVCHQNQGPIFPINPWGDTFATTETSFKKHALDLLKDSEEYGALIGRLNFLGSDFGNIDNDVRLAEGKIVFQRLWVHACGDSNECRFNLLIKEMGLAKYVDGLKKEFDVSQLISQPQVHSLSSANSRISGFADLDPIVFQAMKSASPNLVNRISPTNEDLKASVRDLIDSPDLLLGIISHLKNLKPIDSPSVSRSMNFGAQFNSVFNSATASSGGSRVSDFFNDNSLVGRRLEEIVPEKILAQRILKLYQTNSTLFRKGPFSTKEFLRRVTTAGELKKFQEEIQLPPSIRPKELKVSEVQVPTFFSIEPLNKLIQHCGQCHQQGGNFPPQFLVGTEEEVVGLVSKWKNRILHKIDRNEMPPTEATLNMFVNSGDRQNVVNWLKSL